MDERFHFDKALPDVVKAELERFLPELGVFVPSWCQRVTFYWWQRDDDGEDMSISVNYEYRFASLYVTPLWLGGDDRAKRENIIHELVHVSVGPLANYARETFKLLLDGEPKFRQHADNELRVRHELVTQELAFILSRLKLHA
jgi:hypothetical protein